MNDLNHNLSIIVFSKDRPLQLKAYIDSLIHYAGISESVLTILYTNTPSLSYDSLIKEYTEVNWIKETSFFKDLKTAIANAKQYLMFGCDDVIFKSKIDFSLALKVMASNEDVFGFSLRLGENIIPLPTNFEQTDLFLKWNWKTCATPHWDYPWELDSTIYRKNEVDQIMEKLAAERIKNPNYFESEIALNLGDFPIKDKLASFKHNTCIVLTINRVQDDFLNSFDQSNNTDIHSLYQLLQKGVTINFREIEKKTNRAIHVGTEFLKLQKDGKPYKLLEFEYRVFIKRAIFFLKRFFK